MLPDLARVAAVIPLHPLAYHPLSALHWIRVVATNPENDYPENEVPSRCVPDGSCCVDCPLQVTLQGTRATFSAIFRAARSHTQDRIDPP